MAREGPVLRDDEQQLLSQRVIVARLFQYLSLQGDGIPCRHARAANETGLGGWLVSRQAGIGITP